MLSLPPELYQYLLASPLELSILRKTCRQLRALPNHFEYLIGGAVVSPQKFAMHAMGVYHTHNRVNRVIRSQAYNYTCYDQPVHPNVEELYYANGREVSITRNYSAGGYFVKRNYQIYLADIVSVEHLYLLRRIFAVQAPLSVYRVKHITAPLWPEHIRREFAQDTADDIDPRIWHRGKYTRGDITVELRRHSIILHDCGYNHNYSHVRGHENKHKRTIYAECDAGTVYISGTFYNGSHREAVHLAGLGDVFLVKEQVA